MPIAALFLEQFLPSGAQRVVDNLDKYLHSEILENDTKDNPVADTK